MGKCGTKGVRSRNHGFTLVELLVVIAVIGVLIALLLPAIQKVRESAQRAQCQSQLRQLAIATHGFYDAYAHLPIYYGIDRGNLMSFNYYADVTAPYGGWLLHLLPFIDEVPLYKKIEDLNIRGNNNTGGSVDEFAASTPAFYRHIPTSGTPPYIDLPTDSDPNCGATYTPGTGGTPPSCTPQPPCFQKNGAWVEPDPTAPLDTQTAPNGTIYYEQGTKTCGNCDPSSPSYSPGTPGTGGGYSGGHYGISGCSIPVTGPGAYFPAVYPSGAERTDIYYSKAMSKKFNVLICPSDYSYQKVGYVQSGSWGATNYLANWWYFNQGTTYDGVTSKPGYLNVTDGASNTILYGEAFAECGLTYSGAAGGRIAFISITYHNFGITDHPDTVATLDSGGTPTHWPYGVPNTLMFQMSPLIMQATTANSAPGGPCENGKCCNNWTIQTAHAAGIQVAMGDASVRQVSGAIKSTTWSRAMTPNDRLAMGEDW